MQIDQRAWIVTSYGIPSLKDGEPIVYPVTFANTGKTVAKHVEGFVFVTPVKYDDTPTFEYGPGVAHLRTTLRTGLLTPSNPISAQFAAVKQDTSVLTPILATEELRNEIEAGKSLVIVYGKMTYDDVFGVKHWLHFCAGYGSSMTNAGAKCTAYNDTDGD